MVFIPAQGHQVGCCGRVASVTSACERQQSKDSESHARHLQSRDPLGVARQEPNFDGATSAKRQKVPTVLNIEQIKALLENLKEPGQTAVLLDILTD
jgi:hypothetical protein